MPELIEMYYHAPRKTVGLGLGLGPGLGLERAQGWGHVLP